MKQEKDIEIPFGAFDSELHECEYTIPDGYEAEIKDGKVIVRKTESVDEKIRGAIIDYLKDVNLLEWASWLEKKRYSEFELENEYWRGYDDAKKQGEQKPADKVEPKFKVGDWVTIKE